MSRFRTRISLFTAFLLTTIVGFSIVTLQLWREVAPLREQVRSMRTDLGLLNTDSPNHASAIQMKTLEDGYWKWRVYLPPGYKYHFHTHSGKMAPISPPYQDEQWYENSRDNSGGSTPHGPGEHVIETKIVKEDDKWELRTADGSWLSAFIDGDWPRNEHPFGHSPVVEFGKQSDFKAGERILLLLMRRSEREVTGNEIGMWENDEITDGLAVWIEAEPLPKSKSIR